MEESFYPLHVDEAIGALARTSSRWCLWLPLYMYPDGRYGRVSAGEPAKDEDFRLQNGGFIYLSARSL